MGMVFPGDPFMPALLLHHQHHGGLHVHPVQEATAVIRAGGH